MRNVMFKNFCESWPWNHISKVNSLQEACAKCFVVHTLKFEKTKQKASKLPIGQKLKTKNLMFFVLFFSCDFQDFKF